MIRFPFFRRKHPSPREMADLDIEPDDEDIEETGGYYYKLYNGTADNLIPGDVVKLTYIGSEKTKRTIVKTLLIASTERGVRGNFLSTRNNNLLCCFEVNENSFIFKIILKIFYKKENRCKYKLVPSFLKFVFGLSAFKTLDFNKIYRMEVLLKK